MVPEGSWHPGAKPCRAISLIRILLAHQLIISTSICAETTLRSFFLLIWATSPQFRKLKIDLTCLVGQVNYFDEGKFDVVFMAYSKIFLMNNVKKLIDFF
jgi:hypothetical protein